MSEFNFKSQPCTSKEQSERLLSLGLKKETADMVHYKSASMKVWGVLATQFTKECEGSKCYYPAWSLHRLVSLTNTDDIKIACNEKHCWGGNVLKIAQRKAFEKDNLYDNLIDCIEWLIKEGYFNKEYLV